MYRHDTPVFFRDGDLVFIPPEGVLGVVEVKTSVDATSINEALSKLSRMRLGIESQLNNGILFGFFAYEVRGLPNETVLRKLNEICISSNGVINLVCLGKSSFVKWWERNPNGSSGEYRKWHAYHLSELAPGYFIHNVLVHMISERYWINQDIWFPPESKEFRKDGEISIINDILR